MCLIELEAYYAVVLFYLQERIDCDHRNVVDKYLQETSLEQEEIFEIIVLLFLPKNFFADLVRGE